MKLDIDSDTSQNGHGPAKVDLETGELKCPRCEKVKPGDLENAELEIRKLKRKIKRLERDRVEERFNYQERQSVLDVIRLWADLLGHPNANIDATDRFDVVVARRKEKYEFRQIRGAVYGLSLYPFVVDACRSPRGQLNQRYDRLGLALDSGEHLEKFYDLAAQAYRQGHLHLNGDRPDGRT